MEKCCVGARDPVNKDSTNQSDVHISILPFKSKIDWGMVFVLPAGTITTVLLFPKWKVWIKHR